MRRIAFLSALIVLLAASTWRTSAQQPAGRGNPPLFTGTTTVLDGKDLSVARRRFEPAARTYWHSHDRGQLLLVEDGRMRLQKKGEAMRELATGQSDYTAPNVVHWHGATPDRPVVQVNVGFGGDIKWLDPVTDEEYAGKARR